MECPNCYRQTGSTGRIFCGRKCSDAYRHKVRRLLDKAENREEYTRLWQKYYKHHMPIDRIDSSIGYVEGNIQLVCRAVNMIKNEWNQEDLISFCRKIIEVDKQKRRTRWGK